MSDGAAVPGEPGHRGVVASAPVVAFGVEIVRPPRRVVIDTTALVVALGAALLVSREGAGLNAAWEVAAALVATVPLLIVTRVWRRPWPLLALAIALPLGIVVVAALQQQDWLGSARAARYAWAMLLLLGLAGYSTTARRRVVAAGLAGILVLDQIAIAWLPWWAHSTQLQLMWGQFYWHNQFGAYCAAGAALGIMLVALRRSTVALVVGILIVSGGVFGTFASGSRADLAILAGVLVLALLVAARRDRLAGVIRTIVGAVVAFGVTCLLYSPIFFPTWMWPWSTSAARGVQQTAEESGFVRFEFWAAGVRLGAEHPLYGAGLQQFWRSQSCGVSEPWSSHPHDEFVLDWSEGGAIALIPLLLVAAGVIWMLVRTARAAWRIDAVDAQAPGDGISDAGRWGASIALLALVVHASVDFDWSWPTMIAMAGIVGGIGLAPLLRDPAAARSPRPAWAAIAAAVLVLGIVAAGATTQLIDARASAPLQAVETAASDQAPCLP